MQYFIGMFHGKSHFMSPYLVIIFSLLSCIVAISDALNFGYSLFGHFVSAFNAHTLAPCSVCLLFIDIPSALVEISASLI